LNKKDKPLRLCGEKKNKNAIRIQQIGFAWRFGFLV
jgi:hypothetical protein